MTPQQATQELNALAADLEKLPPTPWSNINSWSMNARPIMQELIPDHLEAFNNMIEEPQIPINGLWTGGTREQLEQYERDLKQHSKTLPEHANQCELRKKYILLFIETLLKDYKAG